MRSTAHAVYKAEELSRQRGLATHTRIRLEIPFRTLSSWAHGLMGHNQTLVPTWLPSDGNSIAGCPHRRPMSYRLDSTGLPYQTTTHVRN